ncbi:hypothetical protein PCN061_p442 (plasmid) [Escherichia coli PCN061]|nr:hypothetical protein PCN061_p442 [Escherichia coli PCN061]
MALSDTTYALIIYSFAVFPERLPPLVPGRSAPLLTDK